MQEILHEQIISMQWDANMKGKIKPGTNEPPRGKPRGNLKGKIHFITPSCGELNPIDFASLLK